MNRHMKIVMFLSVFLVVLSACDTNQVEQVTVKEVPKEGYIILRNDTMFLPMIKRLKQK